MGLARDEMSADSQTTAGYGFGGTLKWVVGGAIGGVVGSLLFGALLWVADPAIVAETIPSLYGFDLGEVTGWAFHVLHGLVLGVLFGYLVTRETILGTITADSQIGWLETSRPGVRLTLARFVYGLAIWALIPAIAATVALSLGGLGGSTFPALAFESLVGHVLYGTLLVALFSVFVEIESEAERAETPFDDFDGADVRR
jgi:hypothetical protein